jgi:hypothetical protein
VKHLALGLLAIASSASISAETGTGRLHLLCVGGGYANKVDQSTAQAWNNYGDGVNATVQSQSRVGFDDQVQLWIEGDEGQILMPRTMLPPIRGGEGGWFKLGSIKFSENEIVGTVKVNPLNNPKVRLDRLTGAINISGKAGDFMGQCQKFDPGTVQRRF